MKDVTVKLEVHERKIAKADAIFDRHAHVDELLEKVRSEYQTYGPIGTTAEFLSRVDNGVVAYVLAPLDIDGNILPPTAIPMVFRAFADEHDAFCFTLISEAWRSDEPTFEDPSEDPNASSEMLVLLEWRNAPAEAYHARIDEEGLGAWEKVPDDETSGYLSFGILDSPTLH